LQIVKKQKYVYSPIRAFSCNWPYIAFSGLVENYLMILNAFDSKVVNRVQVSPDDKFVLICETFITATRDLFCIIKKENSYEMLMMDLDKTNSMEQKDGQIDEGAFKFSKVMSYTNEDVGGRSLNCMFVRGSSRKEAIQTNQKLVIFMMHED
jgi:hypothetical protein